MIKLNGDTIGSKEINTDGTFSEKDTNVISSSAQSQLSGFDPNNSFSVSGLSLSDSGLSKGDQFNFGNQLGTISDLSDTSTPSYTMPGFSGSDDFKSWYGNQKKLGNYGTTQTYKGKPYKIEDSKDPNFGKDKVVEGQKSFTGKYISPGTPDIPEVRGDAFSNFDRRQQVRGVKTGTAAIKRNTMKAARNKAKSIKGKNIFETLKLRKAHTKSARLKAKEDMTDSRALQFGTINNQRKLQNKQGVNSSIGKKNRVILKPGQKGTSYTPASKDKETMEQYFNRSKKKNTNTTF